MSNVQEINQKVQEQTLDVVKKTQDATVDAVTTPERDRQQGHHAAARVRQGLRGPRAGRDHQAVPFCRRGHRFQLRLRRAAPHQPARVRPPHRRGHPAGRRVTLGPVDIAAGGAPTRCAARSSCQSSVDATGGFARPHRCGTTDLCDVISSQASSRVWGSVCSSSRMGRSPPCCPCRRTCRPRRPRHHPDALIS